MKTQNIWDGAKAVLREKFRAIKSHLKKQEKQWIDSLTTPKTTGKIRTKNPQN